VIFSIFACSPDLKAYDLNKKLPALLFAIFVITAAHAQDPSFSQVYVNRIYLNPAFAGVNEGLRLSMSHRSQWPYVPSQLITSSFTAEMRALAISGGLGFMASQDMAGEGFLKTTTMGGIYSYKLTVSPRKFDIYSGIMVNVISRTIDWSKLEFADQFDAVFGKVQPTSAIVPPYASKTYFDFDWGIMGRFRTRLKNKDIYNSLGLAIHHLTQPDESMTGFVFPLQRKFSFHAASMIPLGGKLKRKSENYVSPWVSFETQGKFSTTIAGFMMVKAPLTGGVFYRNRNSLLDGKNTGAVILHLGYAGTFQDAFSFQAAYSYDLVTAGLSGLSYGAHEVSLILYFDSARLGTGNSGASRERLRNCFDYGKKGTIPAL
jgi:type IX secretion system PorP/SprF family membrane protein